MPKPKKYYARLAVSHWADMELMCNGKPSSLDAGSFPSVGYIPVFSSLKKFKAAFPGEPYKVFEVAS